MMMMGKRDEKGIRGVRGNRGKEKKNVEFFFF